MKYLASLSLIFLPISISCQTQKWDGEYYTKNSSYQYEWATSYLQDIKLNNYKSILDLGCGTGNISAYIAQLAPKSTIVGVDLSENMIKTAQTQYASIANLSFQIANAQDFSLKKQFNLIISTSVFHWIKNQQAALESVAQHLAPQGEFYVLMSGKSHDLIRAFELTAQKKEWRDVFAAQPPPVLAYFQDAENMQKKIERTGLIIIKTSTLHLQRRFKDHQSAVTWFMGFVGGVPVIGSLPREEQQKFTRDLIDMYIDTVGYEQNGTIAIDIPSVRIHAIKK